MQTYLFINNSERKALRTSQRILAKYVPQVGQTTYLGSLSNEGVSDLQNELKASRSRYMAVACHRTSQTHGSELLWIVGNKTDFDIETGLFSFRSKTLTPDIPVVQMSLNSKIQMQIIKLAALLHDTGKMNKAFQHKLWLAVTSKNGPTAEFMRHDAVGFYLSRLLCEKKDSELIELASLGNYLTTTSDTLSKLAGKSTSDNNLKSNFETFLRGTIKLLRTALNSKPGVYAVARQEDKKLDLPFINNLITQLVLFVALTHHRLPGQKWAPSDNKDLYTYSKSCESGSDIYFNFEHKAKYGDCTTFEGVNIFQDDWVSSPSTLGVLLQQEITQTEKLLSEIDPSTFDAAHMCRVALHLTRPTLVLADYLGSALKVDPKVAKPALLGNTRKLDKATTVAGDSLPTHVHNVFRHSRKLFRLVHTLISHKLDLFPQLSDSGQRAIKKKLSNTGKFGWQGESVRKIKEMAKRDIPSFCVVTAETGSGKTIASAQIMAAIGSTRYTYCLGRRSLTLQVGASYIADLGLKPEDLTTVIGDTVTQKMQGEDNGSESLEQTEFITIGETQQADWLTYAQDEKSYCKSNGDGFSAKAVNFISSPIAVCTTDQLIGITSLRTVSKAREYLRVYSSDLVFDEIDSYSPGELKHIQKLCYHVGLAGKSIVLMSATIGQVHVDALLQEYVAGLRDRALLLDGTDQFNFITVANLGGTSAITMSAGDMPDVENAKVPKNEAALKLLQESNDRLIALQHNRVAKSSVVLLDTTARDFSGITKEAFRLHDLNFNLVESKRVSIGIVRFNTVKMARRYAKYLFETKAVPDDTAISVLVYHSKFSTLEMTVLDKVLNALTNKKNLDGKDFSPEAMDSYINPLIAAHPNCTNIVMIVVTTSILETGRDHDYDWAIVEPHSHRSLIQITGRIRRHRNHRTTGVTAENISIIRYPERSLTKEGEPSIEDPLQIWKWPGIFDSLPIRETDYSKIVNKAVNAFKCDTAPNNTTVVQDCTANGIIHDEYQQGVTSAIALTAPRQLKNRLALIENGILHWNLITSYASETKSPDMSVFTEVCGKTARSKGMFLTNWAYQSNFRNSHRNKDMNIAYVVSPQSQFFGARTGAEIKIFIANETPYAENGKPANNISADPVNLLSVWRHLPSVKFINPNPKESQKLNDLLEKAIEKEIKYYTKKKLLTNTEILAISGYSPETYSGQNTPWYYSPLLGFNNASAELPV